ncbi:MAG TPA: GTP 3',8-cyclase MoaA [Bdellovibrionales bacterium]|nr:GTP 3',8-cyclase MoaA [Bdellovibrionales bacterium]
MLVDSYSRKFRYLRLSLTEKCNFKCGYCLPNGYRGCPAKSLDLREIANLAFAFKELGVEKIRLTGGEPTLRSDLSEIVQILKSDVGIPQVALTTNGFRLEQDMEELKRAGLDALNISLDSLRKDKFRSICGADKCESVKRSVDRALRLDFKSVKLNCVLLKGLNDTEFSDFLEFAASRPISIRFIELMRTGDNKEYFERHHLPVHSLEQRLLDSGWKPHPATFISGPAKEFGHESSMGRIGFISPYSKDFCSTCNRLRVSSTGGLRLCLFGQGDLPLRSLLQKSEDRFALSDRIVSALKLKPEGHKLHENVFGNMQSLSAIGG